MAEDKDKDARERTEPAPDAAGTDRDSQLRLAKTEMAAAEATGDEERVKAAKDRLDKARSAFDDAAADRREAAESAGDVEAAQTKAPVGRAAPHKAQTRG